MGTQTTAANADTRQRLGTLARWGFPVVTLGISLEYPLFLLNMIGPLASIGSLVVAFPPPGVLKKVFDVIAPDPPEPPEDDEQDQDG